MRNLIKIVIKLLFLLKRKVNVFLFICISGFGSFECFYGINGSS